MVTPGDAAKIGGRPMTGVRGAERLRQIDDGQRAAREAVDELVERRRAHDLKYREN